MQPLPFTRVGDQPDLESGALLLVDKPQGWTSFDVVNKLRGTWRSVSGKKNLKVGHAGTLDPMATGLLLVCTGRWTKSLQDLQGLDKRYSARVRLGESTNTYDAEGEVTEARPVPALSREELMQALGPYIGTYNQFPPAFSAIKKDGKPLYKLARAGHEVQVEARQVTVYSLVCTNMHLPYIELDLHCASGYYVRSLAHDLGRSLGCGAHLAGLRRTHIGPYEVARAMNVEEAVSLIRACYPSR